MAKLITKLAHNINNYLLSFANQTKYLTCFFILLFSSIGWGQSVSQYAYTDGTETYGQITGTTSTATGDDGTQTDISIGFTFKFGGVDYTKFGISTNGIIRLGTNASTTTFSSAHSNSFSTSNANIPLIAAFWDDNNLSSGTIRYSLTGTAPNQVMTINWHNTKVGGSGSTSGSGVSFLIRLYETSNVVELVYGVTISSTNTVSASVGLNDLSSFLSLTPGSTFTSSSSTANNSISSTTMTSLGGKKIIFTPPTPCSGTPTPGTITSNTSQNVCSGSAPAALTVTGTTSGVTGITYQWEQSTDNATWNNVTTGTGATTATYTPPSFTGTTIYYRCKVACSNSSLFDVTNVATISPPVNPTTQTSSLAFSSVSYTGFSASWTNGNGNRRVVYISNAAIVDPTNTTGAAGLTTSTAYTGSGQQIVYDGTGTSVSVTGLAIGTTYYVKVIEYTRCGSGPYDNFFNVSTGTNSTTVTTSSASVIPWSEGFAVGGTLTNWLATADFFVGSSITAINPAISSNYLYVNLDGSPTTASVTTPIIGSIPSNYRFVVKHKLANYGSTGTPPASGSGNFIVAVSIDNGSTYTNVETIANNAVAGWQEYVLNLSAYTGQNIRIRLTGNYTGGDYYLAFDDFSVEAIPSCFVPTALSSSAISYQTATIAWTAPSSGTSPAGYEYEVRTSGAAGSGATGLVTSGTTTAPTVSASLTGLNGGTSYTYYVRSNCGGGDLSSWSSGTFTTTSCNVPTGLTSSSITTTSATISWTAPAIGSPLGYEYEVRTSGAAGSGATGLFISGTTTAPIVTANLTGLSANTSYSVFVRTNCYSGFNSSWTSQTTLLTPQIPATVPYSDDFTSNNLTFVNGTQTNKWAYGAAVGNTGNSIYVSNDNGVSNAYSNGSTSVVQVYRDIAIPAGATIASFSFNWLGNGESTYDYTRVWLVPNSFVPTSGTTITSGSGRIQVGSNFELQSTWQTYTNNTLDVSSFANMTMRLIFEWRNDGSGGSNPPGAIDNVSFSISNVWTGTTSSSWNTASNWSANSVPTTADNIVIASPGANTPILDADITIPAGKSLTLTGSGTLTVASGKTLTIAGTANFGGKAVTFKSDATGTAMFGPLTGTLTGATNVKVERYIPSGKRAFRLLSPAVTTTTFISGNWQQQTHITGGASGGFDVTETNNPSMYTYNNLAASGTGWTAIANTNATNLTAGVGYRMLVRGDRTATNITAVTTDGMNAAITLSATGTLKTGTVALNASSTPAINNTTNTTTADYSLVGNPYQSAVDWNAVTKSGIDATYYAWDPNMGTTSQRGRYVVFNGTTNDNVLSQVGQFIQPGQAFFVKNAVSGTAGTLTFQEANKVTTAANVFRTNQVESANLAALSMQLYDPNELAIGGFPIDATKAIFSADYANELGLGDATKLEAAGENIAWFRNNTKLAIDAAAPVTTSDELAMKTLRLGANKNYTFKIQTTNFDTALTPYLVDTFLNTQTEISTSQAFLASFATTSNAASYSENRFKVIFQNAVLSTDTFATQIGLYPNPSKGNGFYLQLPSTAQAIVKLYNTLGQEIAISHNDGHYQANQSLATGLYHIMVTQGEKTSKLKWIVE